MTELPRDRVPERNPVEDARRSAAHKARKQSAGVDKLLMVVQHLGAFAAGAWAVDDCNPQGSGLGFVAGFGLAAAVAAGYGIANSLGWLWALLNLPHLLRWLKAPPGERLPTTRLDRFFEQLLPAAAVAACLGGALLIAALFAAFVPGCTLYPLWLRLLGTAALLSIPTPRLLGVKASH